MGKSIRKTAENMPEGMKTKRKFWLNLIKKKANKKEIFFVIFMLVSHILNKLVYFSGTSIVQLSCPRFSVIYFAYETIP